jgi:hypothetical protein
MGSDQGHPRHDYTAMNLPIVRWSPKQRWGVKEINR